VKSIPAVLVREKNKLATPNPWIVLLDIVLDATHKLYFCSNNQDVTWSGRVYTAFPFLLEATEENSKGEIPSVSLKVANVTQVIHAYLEQLDGAVGATVTIRVVNAAYLSEDTSELDMTFTVVSTSADAEWIVFTLGAPNPLRRRFPPFRFIAKHCHWEFKGHECGYSGAFTDCDRSFENCEERSNTRRFGGYRGLSEKGWRAA